MGLIRKVAAAATCLWGHQGPESRGTASASRSRPAGPGARAPDAEAPQSLRARHGPPGAGAAVMPEPATPSAGPPEDRVSKGLRATEQRRLAALDQLRQVSAEWTEAQQASAAAQPVPGRPADGVGSQMPGAQLRPRRRPTLAQLFKEQDAREAAEKALAATPPPSQPLSAAERRWLAQALPGGGRAMRRLADRAARADLAVSTGLLARTTRLVSPGPPRPLDAQRRQDFLALLGRDITALAQHAQLDEPSAAALLLRAVLSGTVGTAMHPDDHLLLMGLLDRQAAPREPDAPMPWVPEALGDWWPTLPPAHQRAIEQALEEHNDPTGAIWLAEAQAGGTEAAQALHDHLIAHYRFEDDDRLHRIQPTDTGHARNHLGLMIQQAQPSAGEASAEDLHDAALQAQLDRIHAANDMAIRKHRFLHGDPRPPKLADPQRAGPSRPG